MSCSRFSYDLPATSRSRPSIRLAAFSMETDIVGLLGRDIEAWLDRDFSKWHVKLYKRRPIIWHLASSGSTFGCFVYIHTLDCDTLREVQTL